MDAGLVADDLENQGFDRISQGQVSESLEYFRRALAVRGEAFGECSFEVANTMVIMAGVMALDVGDRDGAAALWRRAADVYERLHVQRACLEEEVAKNITLGFKGTLENLANYSYERGRYEEAEVLFRRAIEVLQDHFGPEGGKMICSMDRFIDTLRRQEKLDEVERMIV